LNQNLKFKGEMLLVLPYAKRTVQAVANFPNIPCMGLSGLSDPGDKELGMPTSVQPNDCTFRLPGDEKLRNSLQSIKSANSFVLNLERKDEHRGVFREKEKEDIKMLVNNFTAPALAEALRDREATLQRAAALLFSNNGLEELKVLLNPFLVENIDKRRSRKHALNLTSGFTRKEIVILQRYLHRKPRQVFHATAQRRASVVIPLCNVNGVASVLFERRSLTVRTHKHEVCFPGGMLDEGMDATIIQTSLREMEEELGIPKEKIEVLGILRCNWNEVASMTGIAVTPVVGFIGELSELVLRPNSDEVEQYFTVSIEDLLDHNNWLVRNFSTPVFTGGPHMIWGLTAYLLEKFVKDVLLKAAH
jgi:nudix motif 8